MLERRAPPPGGCPSTATPLPDLTGKYAGQFWAASKPMNYGTGDRQEVHTYHSKVPTPCLDCLPSLQRKLRLCQRHKQVAKASKPVAVPWMIKTDCTWVFWTEKGLDRSWLRNRWMGHQRIRRGAGENRTGTTSRSSSSPCLLALPRLIFPSSILHKLPQAHRPSPPNELLSSGQRSSFNAWAGLVIF